MSVAEFIGSSVQRQLFMNVDRIFRE